MRPVTDLDIPILETPRLVLRGHRLDDYPAMLAIWSDPVVQAHFHGRALGREDIWTRLMRHFGMWGMLGYGVWAVEEKATGEYVGAAGLSEVKRDLDPALDGVPETGWTLAPRIHGRGYATEAMRAALAWADAELGAPRTFCIMTPENTASRRVAEKCGYRLWRETVYQNEPTLILLREAKAESS